MCEIVIIKKSYDFLKIFVKNPPKILRPKMAQPKNNQSESYVTSIESPLRAESKNIFSKKFGSTLTRLRGFEFWGSGTTPTSGAFWSRRLRAKGPR